METQVESTKKFKTDTTVMGPDLYAQNELPHIVYFNPHAHTKQCESISGLTYGCTWSSPGTWSELGRELENHKKYLSIDADFISQNLYPSAEEFVEAIRTMTKLIPDTQDLHMAVVITKHTPLQVVKQFQQAGVQGVLLMMGDYSLDQIRQALNAFFNGIPYWPRDIMQSLPGANIKKTTTSVRLTPRQQQIFRMIRERGATNKAIARTLKISESTVKLHVTGIFKKFGVRNRTQLAVFTPPDPV